jgi:hypothetical protein
MKVTSCEYDTCLTRRRYSRLLEIIVDLRQVCEAAGKIGRYVTKWRKRFLGGSQGSLDRR